MESQGVTRKVVDSTEGDSLLTLEIEKALVIERKGTSLEIRLNNSPNACLTIEVDKDGNAVIALPLPPTVL